MNYKLIITIAYAYSRKQNHQQQAFHVYKLSRLQCLFVYITYCHWKVRSTALRERALIIHLEPWSLFIRRNEKERRRRVRRRIKETLLITIMTNTSGYAILTTHMLIPYHNFNHFAQWITKRHFFTLNEL